MSPLSALTSSSAWGGEGDEQISQQPGETSLRRWVASVSLTDVIAQLLGQEGVFVEQSQALVHPLLDHVEMRVHLQAVITQTVWVALL